MAIRRRIATQEMPKYYPKRMHRLAYMQFQCATVRCILSVSVLRVVQGQVRRREGRLGLLSPEIPYSIRHQTNLCLENSLFGFYFPFINLSWTFRCVFFTVVQIQVTLSLCSQFNSNSSKCVHCACIMPHFLNSAVHSFMDLYSSSSLNDSDLLVDFYAVKAVLCS